MFVALLWFCCTCNFHLCELEIKNPEGSIFSQISNLCTHRNLCGISKCYVDHIVIVVDDEGYGGCLRAFYRRHKVQSPSPRPWPSESSSGGAWSPRTLANRVGGGCLVSCRDVCNVEQNNYTFAY
jgi:hypothetical protein